MSIDHLGWNAGLADAFAHEYGDAMLPARVSLEHRGLYVVMMERGEFLAVATGKLIYDAFDRADMPVVGDWVATRIVGESDPTVTIHGVLPRRNAICRKEPGRRTRPQPLAANLDSLFLVIGLDGNFNLHRVERYLAVALDSGVQPVVLLTKADLREDVEAVVAETRARARSAPVHAVSALSGIGLEALTPYLGEGKTVALLGSSGVGKSTLLNRLIGEEVQRVLEVREFDSKGRHATTHRQMFPLPSGALLIDTPGIRELQLWDAEDGVGEAFDDIEDLARSCRFSDCGHKHEPGCAVLEAIADGRLEQDRLDHYRKLRRELAYQERKVNYRASLANRERQKRISKLSKDLKKR